MLRHPPSVAANRTHRGVVIVPPLAEEMNRCRRMLFLLGRRLSGGGWEVELPDLYGTGDSDGDFVDARWSIWVDDVLASMERLAGAGAGEMSLIGVRGGALLAAEVARRAARRVRSLVFWQPIAQGRTLVTQLLRTRLAAAALGRAVRVQSSAALREELNTRGSIEIAGYELHRELVDALEASDLGGHGQPLPRTAWFDIVREHGTPASEAASTAAAKLRAAGSQVDLIAQVGVPFWATTEVEVVPELIERTALALERAGS